MIYMGQELHQLTPDALDEAETLALQGMVDAQRHYALNAAFYEEIAEEVARRQQERLKLN